MDNLDKYPFEGIIPLSILRSTSIEGQRQVRNHHSHAIIIKLQGTTEYRTLENTWLLSAGQILFVAKESTYFVREVTSGYSYVVNFESPAPYAQSVAKLPLPPDFDVLPLADKLYRAWQKENTYGTMAALYSLLDKAATALRKTYASPRERRLLEPVMAYLNAHLTDPDLTLDHLSQLAGVSDAYLRRVFKKQYGTAPAGFVIRERIRLAKQLLLSTEASRISQVASQVGYSDPLYFSRLFKKYTGLSPTEYSRAHIEILF